MNKYCLSKQPVAGFTLLELATTVFLVGIVSAIAVPSFTGLINRQRLNNAQEQVFIVMRNAQSSAKRERRTWAACFRDDGSKILSSVTRLPESNPTWACTSATNWRPLLGADSKHIAINSTYTTLRQTPANYYRARFKFDGTLETTDGGAAVQKGKVTLNIRNETNNIKRCVFVSTLLGALRTDEDSKCTI
ncbi:pilus assembly FimT family protein [Synechocystis sp. PCC 7509]|uniref:pilus assembly FimT family protein n=1 Tax=Synechocystis sp. PCC 7509 TaxID=927677 RepID=UPI0002ACED2A|nr:Tfp pilus assembly protein FimT [Synechocystis sp. PCC 7509]